MTEQERLFIAIGGVDGSLLARSERKTRSHPRRYLAWGGAAAACLVLALLLWDRLPGSPAVEPDGGSQVGVQAPAHRPVIGPDAWTGGGGAHFLSLRIPMEERSSPQFYIYVDEESYYTCQQDGVYAIHPRKAFPEGMDVPECVMEVSHMDAAPERAAETIQRELERAYVSVERLESGRTGQAEKFPAGTLACFVASDGLEWDDAQRRVLLVDDGQGGVFVLDYRYFMEATEGHGVLFEGMAATFRAVPADAPAWLTGLDSAVERLMEAVFSGRMEDAADLLMPDAEVDRYSAGEGERVVVRGMDRLVNDEAAPTAAIVTIPYTLGTEEPGGTLVMELARAQGGGGWLAWRIGLEG